MIGARLVALELHDGAAYRAEAARPATRRRALPAIRGRILASDGTVLARDEPLAGLAVQYRYLEEPPDPAWLRSRARARLSAAERRRPERVSEEIERVVAERALLRDRLAGLCGLSPAEWQARCARIQSRVRGLADHVNDLANRRARENNTDANPSDRGESWWSVAGRRLFDGLFRTSNQPIEPIVVAEELSEHVVHEGLSLEAVAQVEGNPDQFPGVRIEHGDRRVYPAGSLAAHLLGYAGRAGIERQYDALLSGREGTAIDTFDRRGKTIATEIDREPTPGRDVVLWLDPTLQRSAEKLLDDALARRVTGDESVVPSDGGAVIVMDVRNGAILAAASSPRFDPAALSGGDGNGSNEAKLARYRADPAHPLFDRTVQMAIPPGSVFKTLTAFALLDSPGFDPRQTIDCQGYLHTPDRQRCAIYTHHGVGHGPVALVDALSQSCNVYFFHYAEEFGPAAIVDWGRRFGFGSTTGIDLPGEVSGHLPSLQPPAKGSCSSSSSLKSQASSLLPLAIGQGSLTVTPLQVVRMMAAVANGGKLVVPRVARRLELAASDGSDGGGSPNDIDDTSPRPIPGLDSERLAIVREGLRHVVADPNGTGYASLRLPGVEIAGKTGTAETGAGRADHAWFAGYAPAESPRVAFVVVLEHAGEASATAAPLARRLVECLDDLGYIRPNGILTNSATTSKR